MAEEKNEVKRINWSEVFSFPQIFKGFRMAIHPSKLLLAFAAIVIILSAGVIMDGIWSIGGQSVFNGEIVNHATMSPRQFKDYRETAGQQRYREAVQLKIDARRNAWDLSAYLSQMGASGTLRSTFVEVLNEKRGDAPKPITGDDREKLMDDAEEDWDEYVDDAQENFADEVENIDEYLEAAYDKAEDKIDDQSLDDEAEAEAFEKLEEDYAAAQLALTQRKVSFNQRVESIEGEGVFVSLVQYEQKCLWNAIRAVRYGNFFGGLDDYMQLLRRNWSPPVDAENGAALPWGAPDPADEQPGFIFNILMAVHGLCWLVCIHWVYAIIFLAISLAVCALLGGAINRIAALHFAREEKISISQALRFSAGKFLSFFTAPLIPVAIVVVVGLLLTLGGFILGNFLGGILMAILFFLAIIGGLLIAFLLIGLAGGVWLMYPTIAVEGSDSFDAISRSFSYIFARPFRSIFYGIVAAVYGVITYLFVRLFAWIALAATHYFVKWGVFVGGDRVAGDADRMDVLWAAPSFDNLWGNFNWAAMGGMEKIAAFIIGIWVFIIAALVAAYLLSFAASATTVIYYLLRRKVDATDLDDVYVEEVEPEEAEVPAGEGEGEAETEEPAGEQPAESEGEEQSEPEDESEGEGEEKSE